MPSAARLLPAAPRLLAKFPSSTHSINRLSRAATRPRPFLPSRPPIHPASVRFQHTIPRPPTRTAQNPSSSESSEQKPSPPPQYELTFTCRPCNHRSRHRVSKHGYHHGSVLVTCPSCKNRHVISDHLRIFGDAKVTIEDILRERGQSIRKGTLGSSDDGEEDFEFWEDGEVVVRQRDHEEEHIKPREKKEGDDAPPGATFKSVRPGDGEKKTGEES
ncbi:DNL zinc finger-domain-containing protein [Echria macrotheca]|uniref:DNL zinc finger-domain-containing protein n=1 Tax=Echria macrotheca TaxID=438768 RepID=A0AAJ0BHD0_9PEZI|nr:DNL zinc finger-domain-containing protein [Echria macrotheca]